MSEYKQGDVLVIYRNAGDLIVDVSYSKKRKKPYFTEIRRVPPYPKRTPNMGYSHDIHSFDDVCLMGNKADSDIKEKVESHKKRQRYETKKESKQ